MKEMNETKKNMIKIGIALFVLLIFLGFNLYQNYEKYKKESEISQEKTIVTDNSRYFTVINCVKKYLNYVKANNTENILLLLNQEYKNLYNINESNLNNFIPSIEDNVIVDYKGDIMYQKRISKNVTEYYVYGQIEKSIMDEMSTLIDYNLTVILYENELLFSIRPGVE